MGVVGHVITPSQQLRLSNPLETELCRAMKNSLRLEIEALKILLSVTFKHAISFVYKSISIYPSFKYPNTHRIFAVIGRLQLIIYTANPLWNICLNTKHAILD
jgi:hypothetical protein